MQQNINYNALTEKWAPLLDFDGVDPIKDQHRRNVTAVLLENQEQMLRENQEFLGEASQPTLLVLVDSVVLLLKAVLLLVSIQS